jgi:hypothetical protein
MGKIPKYPVAMCPCCKRRMVPKGRKPVLLTDRLVEVAYMCESCGTETKRSLREK